MMIADLDSVVWFLGLDATISRLALMMIVGRVVRCLDLERTKRAIVEQSCVQTIPLSSTRCFLELGFSRVFCSCVIAM